MPFEAVDTGIAPSSAPISDANRAGNLVWLVAVSEDPATGKIVAGSIEEQTRRTLMNLEQGVRAAGGTLADIVDVRVFLIDRADAKGMNAVYAEFFTTRPYPVRATVVVKELLADGLRVEMTATAVLASR
jgi:2-iminobutanoate/2-iminopropanoate deaminase